MEEVVHLVVAVCWQLSWPMEVSSRAASSSWGNAVSYLSIIPWGWSCSTSLPLPVPLMSPRDTPRAESLSVPSSWWPGGRYLCSFDAIYLPLPSSHCYFASPAPLCCPGPRDSGLTLCLGKCWFLLFWGLFVTPSPKMGAALWRAGPQQDPRRLACGSIPSQPDFGKTRLSFCVFLQSYGMENSL